MATGRRRKASSRSVAREPARKRKVGGPKANPGRVRSVKKMLGVEPPPQGDVRVAVPPPPAAAKARQKRHKMPPAGHSSLITPAADRFGHLDPHVIKATKYCDDVVLGVIDACKQVKQACQRQLDDLVRFKKHELYRFDEAKAGHACRFIECLPHVEGPKAFIRDDGTPNTIDLEGWQCFAVTTVFGWRRKDTGGRRFRRVYVEVPRGNGKSALSSGIALYCMSCDDEEGAQVYSAATTRDQAKIVWGIAKKMLKKKLAFAADLGVQVNEHSLIQDSTNSFFLPLSREADNLDGLNVHCAIVDELHAHKTREIYDVIETGCQKRFASLLWIITTAGSDTSGICYEIRTFMMKVLDGSVVDETLFGIIYTIDEGDEWTDLKVCIKANPNWNVSVYPDSFVALLAKAKVLPSAQSNFKTKHLNVWVNADQAWMDMRAWDACADVTLMPEQFKGDDCYGGLDLASRTDVAARSKLFRRMLLSNKKKCEQCGKFEHQHKPRPTEVPSDKADTCWRDAFKPSDEPAYEPHYYLFLECYLPEDAVSESKNSQYEGWVIEGRIKVNPGPTTAYGVIKQDIVDDNSEYNFKEHGYDEWQAESTAQELALEENMTMVKVPANVKYYSPTMKELDAAVREKRFHHDGNPVMRWMVSNVVCHTDVNENVFPRKERPENKIDGVISTIQALSRAMFLAEETPPYNPERGIRTL